MGVLYLKQIRRGIIPSHHSTGMTGGCREWKKCPTFGLRRPPTQKSWLRACSCNFHGNTALTENTVT